MPDEETPNPEQPEAVEPQGDAEASPPEQDESTESEGEGGAEPEMNDDEAAALSAAMAAIGQVQGIADSAATPSEGTPFQEPAFEAGVF